MKKIIIVLVFLLMFSIIPTRVHAEGEESNGEPTIEETTENNNEDNTETEDVVLEEQQETIIEAHANEYLNSNELLNTSPTLEGNAYAVLDSQGNLIFFRSNNNYTNKDTGTFTDIYNNEYTGTIYSRIENTGNNNPPWYNERENITTVSVANNHTIAPKSMRYWFNGCSNLTSFNQMGFDTCNVSNMRGMFLNCSSLTSLEMSSFDTTNATSMGDMFSGCSSLTSLDISSFNTSKVTYFGGMFSRCSSLTSLDLSNFDTSNVEYMYSMFGNCSSLTSLNISSFNTSKVTEMSWMFNHCSSLMSLDLSNFNTSSVTTMRCMFDGCSSLTSLDLSSFNTFNVTDMQDMFFGCSSLTSLDLSNFDTSNVTTMRWMFYKCSSLTSLDLSNFSTSSVTNMEEMFYSCPSLVSVNISNFNTNNVTSMSGMFGMCHSLATLNLSNFNTSNVTDMRTMFYSCYSLESLDLSNFNTSNVTNMANMFAWCSSLTSLNLSNFNTINVTSMAFMFHNCSSLTSIDLSNFNTSNVTNMNGMFYECSSLTSLDLSSFNTNNVTNMKNMFYRCFSLISLDLSSFNVNNVTNMIGMFNGCSRLQTINIGKDFSWKNNSYLPYGTWTNGNVTLTELELYNNWNSSLCGVWNRIYTITYSLCGGTNNILNPTTFTYYSNDIEILPPIKEGYQFMGWSINDRIESMITIPHNSTGDRWMGAVWKPYAYAVLDNDGNLIFFRSNNSYVNKTEGTFIDIFNNSYEGIVYSDFEYQESAARWNLEKDRIRTVSVAKSQIICPTSMYCWFDYCPNLVSFNQNGFYTNGVTNMGHMFSNCSSLTSLDLSNFDTSNVEYMDSMFGNCSSLTSLNISSFNTSKVTEMNSMFFNCSALTSLDLSSFNTSKVKYMSSMFHGCSSLTSLDLSNFNTSNLTSMFNMFYNCSSLTSLDLSGFNTDNVSSMYDLFNCCTSLMCITFGSEFTKWINDSFLPYANWSNGDIIMNEHELYNNWDSSLHAGTWTATIIDPYISTETRDIAVIDNEGNLIFSKSNYEFSDGRVSTVYDINNDPLSGILFYYDNNSTPWKNYSNRIKNIRVADNVTVLINNASNMFRGCSNLLTFNQNGFDTSNSTNMSGMFYGCNSLKTLDISSFDTSNVTNMVDMFDGCSSLISLDLSNFNTSNVTNMAQMFAYCSSLTSLNISSFDTTNVTSMDYMFYECSSLSSLDLSNFNIRNVNYMWEIFLNCFSLKSVKLGENFVLKNNSYFPSGYWSSGNTMFTETELYNNWSSSLAGTWTYLFDKDTSFIKIYGKSLTLNGKIGVNFYVVRPDKLLEDNTNPYVMINNKKIYFNEAVSGTVSNTPVCKFVYEIDARETNTPLVLKAYDDNDNEVTVVYSDNNTLATNNSFTYTARTYLDNVNPSDTALYNMAVALADYGSFAQRYFNYELDSYIEPTNAIYTNKEEIENNLVNYAKTSSGSLPEGLNLIGHTLTLKAETKITHYFTLDDGYTIDEYIFEIGGQEVTPYQKGQYYCVSIDDVPAKDLDVYYEVSISDGIDDFSFRYAALSYCANACSESDSKLADLKRAIYLYNQTANAYFE